MCDQDHYEDDLKDYTARGAVSRRQFGALSIGSDAQDHQEYREQRYGGPGPREREQLRTLIAHTVDP